MKNNIKKISLLLGISILPIVAVAQNYPLVGDNVVAVSYPDNLSAGSFSCAYADNLQVQFQANNLPFVASDISVYIDGNPAPEAWIDEQWPVITVLHGLHPGYNTVELVAADPNGQGITREKQVIVGGDLPATFADANYIDCDGTGVDFGQNQYQQNQPINNTDQTDDLANGPVFLNYAVQPWYPPAQLYYYGGGYAPIYNRGHQDPHQGNNGWDNGNRGGVPSPIYHNPSNPVAPPAYHMPYLNNADPHLHTVEEPALVNHSEPNRPVVIQQQHTPVIQRSVPSNTNQNSGNRNYRQ